MGYLTKFLRFDDLPRRVVTTQTHLNSTTHLGSISLSVSKYLPERAAPYSHAGFREFDQYLAETDPTVAGYDAAVENMKVSTRQYAKRQVSWIRNKLIPAVYAARRAADSGPDLYALDATGA